jgi:hypothetical protein
MKGAKRKRLVLSAVVAFALCFAGTLLVLPHLIRARATKSVCIENLYVIDWAKSRWASDNQKTSNAVPSWADLKEAFERHNMSNGVPVCPKGGTYILGSISETPRCSIGGSDHCLPTPP